MPRASSAGWHCVAPFVYGTRESRYPSCDGFAIFLLVGLFAFLFTYLWLHWDFFFSYVTIILRVTSFWGLAVFAYFLCVSLWIGGEYRSASFQSHILFSAPFSLRRRLVSLVIFLYFYIPFIYHVLLILTLPYLSINEPQKYKQRNKRTNNKEKYRRSEPTNKQTNKQPQQQIHKKKSWIEGSSFFPKYRAVCCGAEESHSNFILQFA